MSDLLRRYNYVEKYFFFIYYIDVDETVCIASSSDTIVFSLINSGQLKCI